MASGEVPGVSVEVGVLARFVTVAVGVLVTVGVGVGVREAVAVGVGVSASSFSWADVIHSAGTTSSGSDSNASQSLIAAGILPACATIIARQ